MPDGEKQNWIPGTLTTPEKMAEQFPVSFYELQDFRPFIRIYQQGAAILKAGQVDDLLYLLRCGEAALFQAGKRSSSLQGPVFLGSSILAVNEKGAELRVISADALVYSLDETAFAWVLGDRRWRDLLLPHLFKDLKYGKIVQEAPSAVSVQSLKQISRPLNLLQSESEDKLLRVAKIFSTVLRIIEINKINLPPGSSAWALQNKLIRQITDLLEMYEPTIAAILGDADPVMLASCLKQGTDTAEEKGTDK